MNTLTEPTSSTSRAQQQQAMQDKCRSPISFLRVAIAINIAAIAAFSAAAIRAAPPRMRDASPQLDCLPLTPTGCQPFKAVSEQNLCVQMKLDACLKQGEQATQFVSQSFRRYSIMESFVLCCDSEVPEGFPVAPHNI